jgi:hypothetical protein
MDVRDAIRKAGQILDQERAEPTVRYESALPDMLMAALATFGGPLSERGKLSRAVQEQPEQVQFKSTNFELLCAILDQVPEQAQTAVLAAVVLVSRMLAHFVIKKARFSVQERGNVAHRNCPSLRNSSFGVATNNYLPIFLAEQRPARASRCSLSNWGR